MKAGPEGFGLSIHNPSEEGLEAFLLRLRPFVLHDSPISLERVYNTAYDAIQSDLLTDCLIQARATWKVARRGGVMRVEQDGRLLRPSYVLDLWLNGFYYHQDPKKRCELERIVPHASRMVFLTVLVDVTKQIAYVASVLRVALREGLVATHNRAA